MCTIKRVKRPFSKRPKIGFEDQLSLNAGQKYCRMLQGEHSAILPTFIKLPFVIKIFVLSIFERPFYTGFTVNSICSNQSAHLYSRSSLSLLTEKMLDPWLPIECPLKTLNRLCRCTD